MDKPRIEGALGLAWRPRKNGWAAVWLARQDVARKGYKPTTRQLGVFTSTLTEQQEIEITSKCLGLQDDMIRWNSRDEAPAVFGGTLRDLINAYQTDPDSDYHSMRYRGRIEADRTLKRIDAKDGALELKCMGARDFKKLYEDFRWQHGMDGRETISMAHAVMTQVRMLLSYGVTYEVDPQCVRLKNILSEMEFSKGKKSKGRVTFRQSEDIISAANAEGWHSIALEQALQRELGLRQRDVIGEWVPTTEPGVSDIVYCGKKWLRGLRWSEISSDFILEHPMSKSRTGKVLTFDLKQYPAVMAELLKIPEADRVGAVIKSDKTRRPWVQSTFGQVWRKLATKANVPLSVKNMHNRGGAISEVVRATGGNVEAARRLAGHSETRTTLGYVSDDLDCNNDTSVIVADFRAKNRA